ncbi:hypothetical protein HNV12_28330, partial [Methanococcoides sp. SA1]|nr:hypothetical protein [Methanococcoides sp. SA1]
MDSKTKLILSKISIILLALMLLSIPAVASTGNEITTIQSLSKNTVSPGDTIDVTVHLTLNTDVNGLTYQASVPDGWGIFWQNDYSGVNFKSNTSEWVWATAFPEGLGRTITYQLKVPLSTTTDSYIISGAASGYNISGIETVGQTDLFVQAPTPPVATITSISPNPALEGTQVTLTGSGDDADGSVTAYQWTSDIDGQLSTSFSFSTSSLSIGDHSILFKVQDDDGYWSDEVGSTLSIIDDIEPVITIDGVINPTNIDSQTITGTFIEKHLEIITVNDVTATIVGTTYSASVPLQEGANTITVIARDSTGN